MHLKQLWDLIRKCVGACLDDYAPSIGAALAYYTLFSIAPLLIIAIAAQGLPKSANATGRDIAAARDECALAHRPAVGMVVDALQDLGR